MKAKLEARIASLKQAFDILSAMDTDIGEDDNLDGNERLVTMRARRAILTACSEIRFAADSFGLVGAWNEGRKAKVSEAAKALGMWTLDMDIRWAGDKGEGTLDVAVAGPEPRKSEPKTTKRTTKKKIKK